MIPGTRHVVKVPNEEHNPRMYIKLSKESHSKHTPLCCCLSSRWQISECNTVEKTEGKHLAL